MAKERVINTKFWDDPYVMNLDPIEKLLFLYFLTNPLTNISGIYEISLRRISFDTGIDKDMVSKILDRFAAGQKIFYFDGWIVIANFTKNQKQNQSVLEGIQREIDSLPEKLKNLIQSATDCDNPLHSLLLNLTKLNLTKLNLKERDSRVKNLIDYYHDRFVGKFGTNPMINGPKDGALFKKILEIHSEDTIKQLLGAFFESKEEWIKNSGYSVGVFHSQVNKLISKSKTSNPTEDYLKTMIERASNVISERIPPQNIEAEMATLGAVLIGGRLALDRALEFITAEDFYRESHRVIFESALSLADRKQNIDIITISEELGQHLEKVGGRKYLVQLAGDVPSSDNVEFYANIVKDKSLARQKIQKNNEINKKLYDGEEESLDIITKAMVDDMEIVNQKRKSQIVKIGPEIQKVYGELDSHKGNNGIFGISTGFSELDRICGGLQFPSYNILAARPSIGKSTFALNIAHHVAKNLKLPVLFFSLEMSREQLARKFLSFSGEVNSKLFHNVSQITDSQWMQLGRGVNDSLNLDINLDDSCNLKASEIWVRSRKFKAVCPDLGLIVIDYLQKITGEHSKMSPIERVSESSSICFNIAKELKVPVLTLSQLSRAVEQRDNKIPTLSDLRESGTIEQDADTVLFLYRPDYYNDDKSAPDPSETAVILAKNRLEGGIGAAKLKYYKATQRYTNF